MARETKAQKTARVSALLADFDARKRALRKADAAVEELKAQVEETESGTYGDWVLSRGTPREIVDSDAVKDHFTGAGVPIPKKMSKAPLVITSAHTK